MQLTRQKTLLSLPIFLVLGEGMFAFGFVSLRQGLCSWASLEKSLSSCLYHWDYRWTLPHPSFSLLKEERGPENKNIMLPLAHAQ